MGIITALYRSRFILLMLVILFYTMTVFFIVQLARNDTSKTLGPALRSLSDKIFIVDESISDVNRTSIIEPVNKLRFNHTVATNAKFNQTLLEYIDWNDYEFMAKDEQRRGLGEQGTTFNKTLSAEEQELSNNLFQQYKFNALASDYISLERSTGDTRTDVCKVKKFLKNIPEASVSIIIIFYNEKNSTILRTLHSITNKSPAKLLREIVLVDDFSSNPELQESLENYVRLHFPKVKIVRNTQRHGLIRSRMIGANATGGDILIFFDAHTEVNHNYLPPLVEPIVLDYRKIICPMIDNIASDSMEIRPAEGRERGAFSWDMLYKRLPVYQEDATIPHPVPAMLGAAFAISRKWWDEIGRYDSGLDIWGGEQYEIVFKSWQCGGSVMDAPCSRICHLFKKLPYLQDVVHDNLIERNFFRVASVWMDEYIQYVFMRRPAMRTLDPGDLTEQFALRKRLNCKPFKWFITEVAPDLVKVFPLIDPPDKAWGMLRSNYNSSLCVQTEENGFHLSSCIEGTSGYYKYDWRQNINLGKNCLSNPGNQYIFVFECLLFDKTKAQNFVWDRQSGQIVNIHWHLCIDIDINTLKVVVTQCDLSKVTQSWTFQHFNSTLVDEAWTKYRVERGL